MRIQRVLLRSLWKTESWLGRKLALSTLLTLRSNSELPSYRLHIHEIIPILKRGKKSNNSCNNEKGMKECGGIHKAINIINIQFSSVQSLSRVRLFTTPWIAACQASLSITISRSSLKLTAIESAMHLMIHYNIQPFAQILKLSCLDLNFSFLPLFATCSFAWIFFLSLILC